MFSNSSDKLNSSTNPFRINYSFVHPYVAMDSDPLVQFAVTFSNRDDVDLSQIDVSTHICLVLDISGSMNTSDKYPLLLDAIPCIVDALSDNDWLSIILFSTRGELIWSNDIGSSRERTEEIIQRIHQSGVKFEQTYLSSGLRLAIQEIQYLSHYRADVVNRLYILTDGQLHDAEVCYEFNSQLLNLDLEINSYGFGQDFAEETMRQIMNGCRGGRVKCIYNQQEISKEFAYIGKVAGNLIATDAEVELILSPNVIPGDAFRFEPGTKWFRSIEGRTRLFSTAIGGLEKGRVYKYCFEARLQPSRKDRQQIATAILRFNFQGKQEIVTQEIFVNRSQDQFRHRMTDDEIADWFSLLDGLRTNDPQAQMESLKARLKILRQEGADTAQIELIEQVIDKLVKEGTLEGLSEVEQRRLRADDITAISINKGGYSEQTTSFPDPS
ncbi:VWA domain-containing protein [Laspinema olomoucense]|uniref:VWA domain-containing protein n=1 Tax=Laspinema olomoucense D3b TaxID=2953688 RepID=A0ABT2N651_9CYAN|nr:VWA domain-containing protein [Laspinema sp. D3b]MCT7976761.1 VWA domain-containing protein [Laspinema sp. D3b]